MNRKQKTRSFSKFLKDEHLQEGRKLGQTKPQTPSGEVKPWQPPSKGTSPADRKEDA